MSDAGSKFSRQFLVFAAVSEIGVGLAMMLVPAVVVTLLLGVELSGAGTLVGRFFGISLLALQLACWPGVPSGQSGPAVFRALMTYNVVFALYLAYLGIIGGAAGLLLWPAVGFHAAVAGVLVRYRAGDGSPAAGGN